MSESIDIKLQLAAIVLAQEQSYPRAAERLNISVRTLAGRIRKLENYLELRSSIRPQPSDNRSGSIGCGRR
jgi:hypothetical protein